MKIAFIGTHGVGKTTLCFDLAARIKRLDYSVDLVKEVARDCPLPINRDTTLAAQSWILFTQLARELASVERHEVVVCDRSLLDNYAYLVHRMGRRKELEPLIAAWLPGYTALVKVPIWQTPSFDGVRDVNLGFQHEIDGVIDDLLDDFGVDVLKLSPERQPTWTETVLDYLKLPKRAEQVPLFPEES
jgi:GTPase SAR1 family protein